MVSADQERREREGVCAWCTLFNVDTCVRLSAALIR